MITIFKNKKTRYFLCACFSLCSAVLAAKYIQFNKSEKTFPTNEMISSDTTKTEINHSFLQGMWVPYIDLDVSKSKNTKEAFEKRFQSIVETAKNHNINTLIVHVRSHSDALYPSKIFPTSHILTGVQGENINFDPLKYMVETAHANNLKFHAWINPLRISSVSVPEKICNSNPCKSKAFGDKLIKHQGGLIYNPAYPEVRKLVCDGVKEIADNYNIDAIHFDDYFYPEPENMLSEDNAYQHYIKNSFGKSVQNLEDWRKENINLLIKEVHSTIKNVNPNIEFGISPPGNTEKCSKTGIDISAWLKEGYVDYLCPQIYWSLKFAEMPFEKALNNWINLTQNNPVKLYVGLALYKACTDADCGTWENDQSVLAKELDLVHQNNASGTMIYSANYFEKLKHTEEIKYLDEKLKDFHG
ncbi:MAG: family 10 glycosylhydrolase [Clostridia bacterium]|nr:family 10 glycosylhydrolase [Clostridia bacterium]